MNKTDLARSLSKKSGLTIKDANVFLNAFTETVTKVLFKGENVVLPNFGNFVIAERKARTTWNFRAKQTISVPATKVVKFCVGKDLKEAI